MKILLVLLLMLATSLHFAGVEALEVYLPDFEMSFPFEGQRVGEPEDDVSFVLLRLDLYGIPVFEEKISAFLLFTEVT